MYEYKIHTVAGDNFILTSRDTLATLKRKASAGEFLLFNEAVINPHVVTAILAIG